MLDGIWAILSDTPKMADLEDNQDNVQMISKVQWDHVVLETSDDQQ